MLKSTLIILGLVFAFPSVFASSDTLKDGESFPNFFRSITNGNHKSRGITFDAPEAFQNEFLARYKLASWVGDESRQESALTKQSIDLWGDWYQTKAPARLALPTPAIRAIFAVDFERARSQRCSNCRPLDDLWNADWSAWTVKERALFATTYVLQSKIFAGRRLIDFTSDNFGVSADNALALLDVKILPHDEFVKEVRCMGWKGEIYFRGITGPEPLDEQRVEILLDGDFLRDRSENTIPLFQMYEYIGILTHELNHVFQTLDSRQLGFDLQIKSMEGAILIEGGAEYLAEKAMQNAALAGGEPALALYTSQQAIGLMEKDAEKDLQFLPYKIGLPFAQTLYKSGAPALTIRTEMYKMITGNESLEIMVKHLFSPH